jgi:hypothetical protein
VKKSNSSVKKSNCSVKKRLFFTLASMKKSRFGKENGFHKSVKAVLLLHAPYRKNEFLKIIDLLQLSTQNLILALSGGRNSHKICSKQKLRFYSLLSSSARPPHIMAGLP